VTRGLGPRLYALQRIGRRLRGRKINLGDNHKAAVALHFMHYNRARIHKTLCVTPAMESGVADHVWALYEIARLAN
jgi:hypothetical protein